jgi:hypothetical protein
MQKRKFEPAQTTTRAKNIEKIQKTKESHRPRDTKESDRQEPGRRARKKHRNQEQITENAGVRVQTDARNAH